MKLEEKKRNKKNLVPIEIRNLITNNMSFPSNFVIKNNIKKK